MAWNGGYRTRYAVRYDDRTRTWELYDTESGRIHFPGRQSRAEAEDLAAEGNALDSDDTE